MSSNRPTALNRKLETPDLLRKPIDHSVDGIYNTPLRDRAFEPDIPSEPIGLGEIDTTGAIAGDVITLVGGAWEAHPGFAPPYDNVTFTLNNPPANIANIASFELKLFKDGAQIAYPASSLCYLSGTLAIEFYVTKFSRFGVATRSSQAELTTITESQMSVFADPIFVNSRAIYLLNTMHTGQAGTGTGVNQFNFSVDFKATGTYRICLVTQWGVFRSANIVISS